jgi:hypothetical protein
MESLLQVTGVSWLVETVASALADRSEARSEALRGKREARTLHEGGCRKGAAEGAEDMQGEVRRTEEAGRHALLPARQ